MGILDNPEFKDELKAAHRRLGERAQADAAAAQAAREAREEELRREAELKGMAVGAIALAREVAGFLRWKLSHDISPYDYETVLPADSTPEGIAERDAAMERSRINGWRLLEPILLGARRAEDEDDGTVTHDLSHAPGMILGEDGLLRQTTASNAHDPTQTSTLYYCYTKDYPTPDELLVDLSHNPQGVPRDSNWRRTSGRATYQPRPNNTYFLVREDLTEIRERLVEIVAPVMGPR